MTSIGDGLARTAAIVAPLAVAGIVIATVWPDLMPGVAFWDTGEFQTVLPILGTAHPTGYPTYVILGFLANLILRPLGEPAFRMNVLSLLCVAAAAGVTARLAARLSGSAAIGAAAGLGLAATPIAWNLATHADPHTLHLAFVAVLMLLLVGWEQRRRAGDPRADRWLLAAAAVFGLSAGNHSLTLLLAAPIGLYVLAVHPGIVRRPGFVARCVVALAVPLVLVYLELPLRAGLLRAPLVYGTPNTWDGFWYIALAEQFRGSLVDPLGNLPGKLGDLAGIAGAQFGLLAPAILVGFLATVVRQPRYALLSGSAMLITVLFNASYTNADIQRYYLGPALWAWTWLAVLAGVIVEQVAGPPAPMTASPGPVAGSWTAPSVSARPAAPSGWSSAAPLPVRAGLAVVLAVVLLGPTVAALGPRARAADERHDDAAGRWLDAVLPQLDSDAVVVSWWSTSTPLWYAQYVEGQRPDIFVVDDRTRLDLGLGEATDVIAEHLGTRPVYVIRANSYDLGLVTARYRLTPLVDAGGAALGVYRVDGLVGSGG